MSDHDYPRLLQADRLDGGIVVKFQDGHCGFYSAALLFSMLAASQRLDECEEKSSEVV